MTHILKLFEVWGTHLKQSEFLRATIKLTAYYIFSTFCILLITSSIVLNLFTPKHPTVEQESVVSLIQYPEIRELNMHEFREHLPSVLFVTDITILFFVSIFSYFFARRTLRPVEKVFLIQKHFVGDVAHELRTPLTVMQSGAETILRKERTVPEYQEFIKESSQEIKRLSTLTHQLLLLLSEDTVARYEFSLINLTELVKQQIFYFKEYSAEQHVETEVKISREVFLKSHKDSIIQILQNLIKNAIDHNHDGGKVSVTLSQSETETILSITDTGVGISAYDQQYVFNRFYKANKARSARPHHGSGLGLAIVKEIVEKINARIALKSSVGVGTTVTIFFLNV